MRALLIIGAVLIVLGILSIFVPVPYRERHGIDAGPVSINVTTKEQRQTPPAISATLIIVGGALVVAGARRKR